MGIAERKKREKELRREAIIKAATEVFKKKGLTASTMEDIARRAELSKATLYLYFTNKEELFLAVLLIVTEVFNRVMAAGQKAENSEIENLHALGRSYLEFYKKYPAYYNLLNTLDPAEDFNYSKYAISEDIVEANARIWETVCAPIILGMQKGIFKADTNPLQVGMTLWMGSTGIINLMDHVSNAQHHQVPQELPDRSAMKQLGAMEFETMLDDLWAAIINHITNPDYKS
jgi:TetR/AcrR family transcriptional regulator